MAKTIRRFEKSLQLEPFWFVESVLEERLIASKMIRKWTEQTESAFSPIESDLLMADEQPSSFESFIRARL